MKAKGLVHIRSDLFSRISCSLRYSEVWKAKEDFSVSEKRLTFI